MLQPYGAVNYFCPVPKTTFSELLARFRRTARPRFAASSDGMIGYCQVQLRSLMLHPYHIAQSNPLNFGRAKLPDFHGERILR